MPTTYAIAITEKNLGLIEFLNDGVRPLIEDTPTYFIAVIESRNVINTTIKDEDELYDDNGHQKGLINIIL